MQLDVERAIALELRDALALVDAALAARVFTVTPREVGADPFLLVQRVGGAPPFSRPFVLDVATLQVGAYGGSKRQALVALRAAQAALSELQGAIADGVWRGYVTGVELGAARWLPDEAFEPARARYLADVDVSVRSGELVEPAGSTVGAVTPAATDRNVNR